MKRLSIIVPVYNVETYLERCLRSLEDQDIPRNDFEIICINDGSTDNSREVIRSIQGEFENIILFDQKNQGVSVARNNGMDVALGEYFMMVDADDYVKPNVLRERLDILDQSNSDVGFAGYISLNENMIEEYRFDPLIETDLVLTGIEFINRYLKGKSEISDPHRSWAIFLKSSFINSHNLRYLEGVPYLEDGELVAKITCLADRVIFINGPIYMRTKRPGSATTSRLFYSEEARNGYLKAANNLLQFKVQYCNNEKKKIYMNQHILQFTIVYLISFEGLSYLKHYSEIYHYLKEGPLKILQTEGCSNLYRKMGKSYNYSIHCFYLVWYFFIIQKSLVTKTKRFLKLGS